MKKNIALEESKNNNKIEKRRKKAIPRKAKEKLLGPTPSRSQAENTRPLHLVLSGPAPCFYLVTEPSCHLTVKE